MSLWGFHISLRCARRLSKFWGFCWFIWASSCGRCGRWHRNCSRSIPEFFQLRFWCRTHRRAFFLIPIWQSQRSWHSWGSQWICDHLDILSRFVRRRGHRSVGGPICRILRPWASIFCGSAHRSNCCRWGWSWTAWYRLPFRWPSSQGTELSQKTHPSCLQWTGCGAFPCTRPCSAIAAANSGSARLRTHTWQLCIDRMSSIRCTNSWRCQSHWCIPGSIGDTHRTDTLKKCSPLSARIPPPEPLSACPAPVWSV